MYTGFTDRSFDVGLKCIQALQIGVWVLGYIVAAWRLDFWGFAKMQLFADWNVGVVLKRYSQNRSKHIKGSKERLFIMTQIHRLQICWGNSLCQAVKRHLNNSCSQRRVLVFALIMLVI